MSQSSSGAPEPGRALAASRLPLFAVIVALAANAASADWLVTRDGTRLQTRGEWTVDGGVVRFRDSRGALRALRVAEVDLDASRAASTAAAGASAARPNGVKAPPAGPRTMAAATSAPGPAARAKAPEGAGADDLAMPVVGNPAGSPLAAAASATRNARTSALAPAAVLRDGDVAIAGPETVAAVTSEAARAAEAAAPIVLYGTSWCGYCKKAKALLASLGAGWVERDVEKTPGARAELDRLVGPGAGVPVLVSGGRIVRGFDAGGIRALVAQRRAPGLPVPGAGGGG
jgi:glutaredoxin